MARKSKGNGGNPPAWSLEEYERALSAVKARTEVVVFVVSLSALVHVSAFAEGNVPAWTPRYLNGAKRWARVRNEDIAPHEAWWLACMCAGLRDAIEYAFAPEGNSSAPALALVPPLTEAPVSYVLKPATPEAPFAPRVVEIESMGHMNDNARENPDTCAHRQVRPILSLDSEECCACGKVAELGSM